MKRWWLGAIAFLVAASAAAQQPANPIVVAGRDAVTSITVVGMPYEGTRAPPPTDVAAVIRADLNRSGLFDARPGPGPEQRPTRAAQVRYADWAALRQRYLVIGRLVDSADGGYRVEYELHSVDGRGQQIAQGFGARGGGLRRVAHQIADQIFEKVTGLRGAFDTRLVYISATPIAGGMRYAVVVADADGQNPQEIARNTSPFMSPAWSPDGRRLAYVSFERGNSTIYLHEIATGAREAVASFRGINGAPAFSPDGSRLAMTLSKDGNPDIYVMDLASRQLRQLTRHFSIDTEPVWAADGQSLLFTSDRGGKPQIYQVAVAGGEASRVSFGGDSNARASMAPDGQRIAVAQGSGNIYRIAVLDRSGGGSGMWQTLSPGNLDESPSFSPNGSMLLYAAKEGRRGQIYVLSANGRVRERVVLAEGDVREPAWGPFRQR
jgi:TolB protein